MADSVEDSFLREIDEDLRQERYAKLWQTYGKFVIAGAVALVVAVAGYQLWHNYDIKTRSAEGEQFEAALKLAANQQVDTAAQAFAKLAAESSSGYALLAHFQEAAMRARGGDREAAALAYREIAGNGSVAAVYRDLAVILGTLAEMEIADPNALRDRLAPLLSDDNPWRHSARELTALLALRLGDKDKARNLLQGIASDATAPRGMRSRAGEMMLILGK